MADFPFTTSGQVVLDANGYGVLRFAPAGTSWKVTGLTVTVDTHVLEASVNVYRGFIGTPYLVDATPSGSSGDTSDTEHDLPDGTALFVEWTGGDPLTYATAVLRGTQQVTGGFRAV